MLSKDSDLYSRGIQLITFKGTRKFTRTQNGEAETVYTSRPIPCRIAWNELIASWNIDLPTNASFKIEARAVGTNRATDYYCLGLWSVDPHRFPRECVLKQQDANGSVDTDTLILNERWNAVQLRLTLGGSGSGKVRFLALSLLDNTATPPSLPPHQKAWGRTLPVPEKSQMVYPNGNVLCSPTTVSMILEYWAARRNDPVLRIDVPDIKSAVFDRNWDGTGNWSFNMAYAGSLPGMRAYVVRLSDLRIVEELVNRGVPVGLSICYNRLRGRVNRGPSGHLVACVGFTREGDVILNDPGTRENVQKTFTRDRVKDAWAHSKNAAYIIFPKNYRLPADKYGEFR
jgi:hypothetical protein